MSDEVVDPKEKLLLEYAMADREVFIKCYGILDYTYFDQPLDRVVRFVTNHFSKHHGVPDSDLVYAETGIELKEREIDETEKSYVLEEIEDFCSKQAMSQAILKSVDLVDEGNMAEVQQLVRDALSVKIDKNLGIEFFDEIRQRIERSRMSRQGYKTYIDSIDSLNGGQYYKGELNMVAAATSTGKSVMLANIAERYMAQGMDCAIISVEMDEDPYSIRLDSIISGMDINTQDMDKLETSLANKSQTYGNLTIKRVNNKFGLEDVRTYFMEYHLRYGKYPDVFILDYLDIFANGTAIGKQSVSERDEYKTHTLRDILIECNTIGWTASQLNRESYTDITNVSPAHIAGGLSKANGVDFLMGMIATDEDLENNQLQLKGLKVRNAEKSTQMATIYRCPRTLRLSDQPFNNGVPTPKSPVSNANQTGETKTKSSQEDSSKSGTSSDKGKDKLKKALTRMK